jgi:hypothetical protein
LGTDARSNGEVVPDPVDGLGAGKSDQVDRPGDGQGLVALAHTAPKLLDDRPGTTMLNDMGVATRTLAR